MAARAVRLLIINGGGLDVRGLTEENRQYFRSRCTLTDIEACVRTHAQRMGIEVQLFQSSDLGHCIQRLESAQEDAVVINPGSFMNEDALALCLSQLKKPSVEVHYGNFFAKGKTSKVSGACSGIVAGFKLRGYELAMEAAAAALRQDYNALDYTAAAPP